MNVHDSEKIAGIMEDLGYEVCSEVREADAVIFNTCCIRETAEQKIYGHIGELKKIKRAKPDMIVAVCGCMSQQTGVAEKIKASYPFVDIILGTSNLNLLRQAVLSAQNKKRSCNVDFLQYDEEDFVQSRTSYPNAWVNINYGCNNFCTYCIVPYVRGRERSRKSADILSEVKSLLAEGYKEITLLGQNVNSYGHDLKDYESFASLLRKIGELDGKFRPQGLVRRSDRRGSGVSKHMQQYSPAGTKRKYGNFAPYEPQIHTGRLLGACKTHTRKITRRRHNDGHYGGIPR